LTSAGAAGLEVDGVAARAYRRVDTDDHRYACPYSLLAAEHRDITCGMNLAWAEGVVEGLGVADVSMALAPEPGR
jgi:hypothetical protein